MAGLFETATETPEEKAARAAAAGGGAGGGAPGTIGGGSSGTTQGAGVLQTTGPLGATVSAVPVVGGIINGVTRPQTADLTPTHAAQNAAFGLGADIGSERAGYKPVAAPTLNTRDAEQTRIQQEHALGMLSDAANGRVPSAADLEAKRMAGTSAANVLGTARALGGRSAGGVARSAALGESDILARAGADAAARRASEQSDARNQLTAALGGVRAQDIGTANANLGAATANNTLNSANRNALLDAQLKAYGIGTTAAGDTVQAAKDAAAAENKAKGGVLSTVEGYLGL